MFYAAGIFLPGVEGEASGVGGRCCPMTRLRLPQLSFEAQLDQCQAGLFFNLIPVIFHSFHVSDMLVAASCVDVSRCPFVCEGSTFSQTPMINWVNWELDSTL